MKSLLIFASILLVCQCNKLPQEVVHKVTVPVPSIVLSAPPLPSAIQPLDTEIPAVVKEVTKNHKPNNEQPQLLQPEEVVLTTIQPETKTIMPDMDLEITTLMDPLIAVETQPNVMTKTTNHRAMRSVLMAEKPMAPVAKEMVTQNPVIKSVAKDTAATIDPCDLLCTKFEFEPICATNGLCLHEFPNQCILETFNCKHKSGKFTATKDDRCQMHWLTKCEESDVM